MILKFQKDLFLNMLSIFLSLAFLQLYLYPEFSKDLPKSEFGIFLSLIGFINFFSVVTGGSLGSVRLLKREYYDKQNYADYKLLYIYTLTASLIFCLGSLFSFNINLSFTELIFMLLLNIAITSRSFFLVYLRLSLDYKNILLNSLFNVISIGILSLLVSINLNTVLISLFVGELIGLTVFLKNTEMRSEIYLSKLTSPHYHSTKINYFLLVLTNAFNNITNYVDKFVLLPLIGAGAVTSYYVSSFAAKIILAGIAPITSVILTYLTLKTDTHRRKFVNLYIVISLIISLISYILIYFISDYLIFKLYSKYYNEVVNSLVLVNTGIVLTIFSSLLQPLIMKNCNLNFYSKVQIALGVFFVLSCFTGTWIFGLNGFYWSLISANFIKALVFLFLLLFKSK